VKAFRPLLSSVSVGLFCGELLFAAVLMFHLAGLTAVTAVYDIRGERYASATFSSVAFAARSRPASSSVKTNVPMARKTKPASSSTLTQTPIPLDAIIADSAGPPLFLNIPELDLRAAIQEVGVTSSSAVGIPTNYVDVGWFRFGPEPGQVGNAIMDGHVVTHNLRQPGVFKNLNKLRPGDLVRVETARATLIFKVTKTVVYGVDQAPLAEIFGATQKRALNLITCDGAWIQARRMYSERLVVFTELVPLAAK